MMSFPELLQEVALSSLLEHEKINENAYLSLPTQSIRILEKLQALRITAQSHLCWEFSLVGSILIANLYQFRYAGEVLLS